MRTFPQVYSQRDARWAGNELGTVAGATIGAYGCILTCHAMKAGYYNHQIAPDALNDIYRQKNLYISGDLIADGNICAVFNDIQLVDTQNYASVPADLNYLKEKASDPTLTVTIEIDFDHDPNDGIQTHFVELHEFDGTTLTIYDPWYGTNDNFTLHYGTNLAQTIQKVAVYKGIPTAGNVEVDQATFQKLVTNSTAYDGVCDALGEPHNTSKDKVVADINQLKLDKQTAETNNANLNKQIPVLEGQIQAAKIDSDNLTKELEAAKKEGADPNSGFTYQKLYAQSQTDLSKATGALQIAQTTINQLKGQLSSSKPKSFMDKLRFLLS